jgi:hypothetical protein
MAETKATTIRLTDEGRRNAERIIKAGAAADISSAVFLATRTALSSASWQAGQRSSLLFERSTQPSCLAMSLTAVTDSA